MKLFVIFSSGQFIVTVLIVPIIDSNFLLLNWVEFSFFFFLNLKVLQKVMVVWVSYVAINNLEEFYFCFQYVELLHLAKDVLTSKKKDLDHFLDFLYISLSLNFHTGLVKVN